MHSCSVRAGEISSDALIQSKYLSKMDDEKLIECVRSYPALYNLANSQYLDTKYKNYLWRKIAVELSFTENDWVICKQRWTNIRDQYKKNLKSLKTTTGLAAKKIKLYKFYEQLQFLKDADEDRDKIENFVESSQIMLSPPSEVTLSRSNNSNINQQPNSQTYNDVVASPSVVSPVASLTTNKENESPPDLPKQRQTNSRLKKKGSAPVPESASSTLMKYVLMNKNNNTEKGEQHPIDAFLQGLAPTLKSFSPYLQHVAKGKIFQVIHDLELQQLTENLTSSPSTPIILSSPSPSSPSMSVISSRLSSYEQPETLESLQLPEQPGPLQSIQLSEQPGTLDSIQLPEQPGTLDSIQFPEQPGSSKSIQLYFSQYDSAK